MVITGLRSSGQLMRRTVRRPSAAYALLGSLFDLEVVKSTHVAGVDNVVCDQLSRGEDPARVLSNSFYSLATPHTLEVIQRFLLIIDPTQPCSQPEEFFPFWSSLHQFLRSL